MARRPQEHDRRPTVVTSGPQAGTARAGSTVNKGVHYDEAASSVQGTKDGLMGLASEPPERPDDVFMPERLRVLPENPAELFSNMEVAVPVKDGERHRVLWTPDGVELLDHDYVAEKVVQSLDGEVCRCVDIKDAWESDPAFLRSDDEPFFMLKEAEVVSGGGEGGDIHEDFFVRMGKTGASLYVARQAVDAWLGVHGVPPLRDERTVIAVFNGNRRIKQGASSMGVFSGGVFEEDSRPVLGYATWTPSSPPRFSGMVTSDFYDEIRNKGYVVDGKLNLGSNSRGQVLLHIDPDSGDAFSVQQGAPIAENKYPHPREPRAGDDNDNLFVGVRQVWEDNGEYYYTTEGVNPVGVHRSAADAELWARHENVRATMIEKYEHLTGYVEEFDPSIFPPDFDILQASQCDLMELAASQGERPTTFSIGFTYYMTVGTTKE